MTEPAIHVADLRKAFHERPVLNHVSFTVPRGSIFALLGANGAGKTTLIRILATLLPPDGGDAWIAGHHVVTAAATVRRLISLTGQQAAVDPVLTGRENLSLLGRLTGLSRAATRDRVAALLAQFELTDAADRRTATYSGGMRRRLDLALSLMATPAVIFLDEPTTGLDPRSRQLLWAEIRALARAGTTILLTTQYLDEADQLADTVALLHGGRIVAQGRPAALKATAGHDVVELRTPAAALLGEAASDGTVAGLRAAIDRLPGPIPADALVSIRKPTLDDVYFALTGPPAAGQPVEQAR